MKKIYSILSALMLVALVSATNSQAQNFCQAGFVYSIGNTNPNGTQVSFYDSSSTLGTITNWNWTFNNGLTSNLANPVTSFQPGTAAYVCLTITSVYQNTTCTSNWCDTIYIPGSATCNASFTANVFTQGNAYFNMNAPAAGSTYSWNFGDGSPLSTQTNPTHTFPAAGVYSVCVTVTTSNGITCNSCQQVTIANSTICNAGFTYVNSPTGITFVPAVGNVLATYYWSFGDSTYSTAANPTHVYTSPGTFTACLTISYNGMSCTSCQQVIISGLTTCSASFNAYPDSTGGVYFNNTSTGNGLSYYWSFSNGATSNLQNPYINFGGPGVYSACLTIYDVTQTCTDNYCDSIVITNGGGGLPCNANFTYQYGPSANTALQSVFFQATSINSATASGYCVWSFGDGSNGTGPNVYHTYTSAGTYTVCLTVTTPNGTTCSSCQVITVTPFSNCSSNFALYPDSVQAHTYYAVNLAWGNGPLTYTWIWGDGTSSTGPYPSHTYAAAGLYTICLMIADQNGCFDSTCYNFQLLRVQENNASSVININVIPAGSTGIQEQSAASNLTVYPVPSAGLINASFDLKAAGNVSIRVMDVTGRVVFTSPASAMNAGNHNVPVDLNTAPAGIYMLEIMTETGSNKTRIVIQ